MNTPNSHSPSAIHHLLDDDGYLRHHNDWTPQIAQTLADSLQIHLTQEHLMILYAVREFYDNYHHSPSTRPLIKYIQQTLPMLAINNAKLQQLFKTGLIARHINRLAGLPKPANCL